jgi:hypothetical protein
LRANAEKIGNFKALMRLFAYVDPGLGALLWQAAVAGMVGFLFYLKITRRWIVDMFRKMFGRGQKTEIVATEIAVTAEDLATKVETKTEVR